MKPEEPTIVQISEFPHFGPGTVTRTFVRVQFNVGVDGPFSVELEKDKYTAAAARAAMQPIVDQVNQTHGRTTE